MNIRERLSQEFVGPTVRRFGLEPCPDAAFRKWSQDGDICAIVQVRGDSMLSVEIAFFSRFIWSAWELEDQESPTVAMCNTCGIVLTPDVLAAAAESATRSWAISSPTELAQVGGIMRHLLQRGLGRLLQEFMTLEGWVRHFRREVTKAPKGRGYSWAMLGYSLLGLANTTLEDIGRVIEEHSRQDASVGAMNRLEGHLERQRKMVFARFGVNL